MSGAYGAAHKLYFCSKKMKNIKTIIIFFFICSLNVSLFSQWQFDATLPYNVHLPRILQVCVIDSSISWALGNVTINQNTYAPYISRRTRTGWNQIINSDLNDTVRARTITAKDSSNIWLGTYYPEDIYFSSNGGSNWILQCHISDTAFIEGIMFNKKYPNIGYAFASISNVYGMADGVRILKTSNNGQNWSSFEFEMYGYSCTDASMATTDSNYAWFGITNVVGRISKIIMTSNGGMGWNIIDAGLGFDGPFTLQFSDDNQTGVYIGENGTSSNIYRTTNSGFNWSSVYNMSYYYSKTMRWVSGTSNIYGNSEFETVRSIDDGNNWSIMTGEPTTNLISLDAVRINEGTIYALLVTSDRQVYKLIDTARVIGIEKPNTSIPKQSMLYQNYPNPFNPVTKIKFDLPKNEIVTIKIYDLLGREIAVLINNEYKIAGSYELEWNAANYPSGIYFYRLESGDFVSTKKMVLIK